MTCCKEQVTHQMSAGLVRLLLEAKLVIIIAFVPLDDDIGCVLLSTTIQGDAKQTIVQCGIAALTA